MKPKNQGSIAIALAFVGVMFFAIGFALGINSFLIPVLQSSLNVSSGVSYLILTATFSTFIIFGYPASLTIAKIGYKRTMSLSFLFFAMGFGLYILSANHESFGLFLLASFVSGTGNTFLQASVNPYTTILGPIESAARRISIMGICNKLAWPVAPVFLAWVIGKDVTDTLIGDLYTPFYIIIAIFLLLGLLALAAPLPEVKAVGEDEDSADDCPYAAGKTSVWQFPHLLLGALALFLYVGVETVTLSTMIDYAESIGMDNAAIFGWVSSIGMVVGYICGILLIPKYLSQSAALKICAFLGVASTFLVTMLPAEISIWCMALMALSCSLMWPAIWPLAMTDLGKYTKTGSSLLVMAIAGGAVIPTIFGFMKDGIGVQNAYWIALPCFLFILYYALRGCNIRTHNN